MVHESRGDHRRLSLLTIFFHFRVTLTGGQPPLHVLPTSQQPFLGRISGPSAAAPTGLEGARLHDHLVLDGEPLIPRRCQDRQGAQQCAVLVQGPEVAQGTLSTLSVTLSARGTGRNTC